MKRASHPVLRRAMCLAMCLIAALACLPLGAGAYFNQGPVGVTLGQQSVTLEENQQASISVSFSPNSSRQLPGCGMAECPQTCGEKKCLDENGQCTCNGTTYQSYYAYATVSSSNTSVATAVYSDGIITVSAISPGTATITVTASLRQYFSTTATISVTVNGSAEPAPEPTAAPAVTPGTEPAETAPAAPSVPEPTEAVTVTPVTEPTEPAPVTEPPTEPTKSTEPEETEPAFTVIESDRGPIYFVPIEEGPMGMDVFNEILGQQKYVNFQRKDGAENILYAWEFCGEDLTVAEDLVLTLNMGSPEQGKLYISFTEDGELPTEAQLYIRVTEHFTGSESLKLYAAQGEELLQEDIAVENGYVSLRLSQREDLILTARELEQKETAPADTEPTVPAATEDTPAEEPRKDFPTAAVIAAVAGVLALAVVGDIVYISIKKRKAGNDD